MNINLTTVFFLACLLPQIGIAQNAGSNELEVLAERNLSRVQPSQPYPYDRSAEGNPQGSTPLPPGASDILVGCPGIEDYCQTQLPLPDDILDSDGGEIRLIMQNEFSARDSIWMVDISVACEWTSSRYGANGNISGRTCWVNQSDLTRDGDPIQRSIVLGDDEREFLYNSYRGWAWITDFAYNNGNAVLNNNSIQIMTHPFISARVIFYD